MLESRILPEENEFLYPPKHIYRGFVVLSFMTVKL